LKRAGLALILGIGAVMGGPSLALASCIAPPPFEEVIRRAPAVFVGTVIDLHNGDRTATVDVSEVWKGAEVPAEVEVQGGPSRVSGFTSVDRNFELSREYLFVPYKRNGSVFRDNACTRTTLFRTELTRLRPSGAYEPSATLTPESPTPEVDEQSDGIRWLLLGAAIMGSALIALVLFRRR
jgi:hypothetical protein